MYHTYLVMLKIILKYCIWYYYYMYNFNIHFIIILISVRTTIVKDDWQLAYSLD